MKKAWTLSLLLSASVFGSVVTASAAPAPSAGTFDGGRVTGTAPASATAPAMVKVVTSDSAGTMLADGDSRALYLWTRDERNKSGCVGPCAEVWPPVLTLGAPMAGAGVAADRLGSIMRADGTSQVTFNGWPLYYFRNDAMMGDVKGQGVNNVWFVVSPYGGPRQNFAAVKLSSGMMPSLADASGRALYLYSRDDPNKSNCLGACALNWPPVLSIGAAKAEMGVNPAMLGLLQREDGSTQVTYKEMPLYYFSLDEKPGDMKGQAASNVWWLVNAAGAGITTVMMAPAAPMAPVMAAPGAMAPGMMAPGAMAPGMMAPAVPAALPRTGEPVSSALMVLMGAAGAMAAGVGAWARRRFTN